LEEIGKIIGNASYHLSSVAREIEDLQSGPVLIIALSATSAPRRKEGCGKNTTIHV
jgi:hypothetical protein